MKSIKITHFFDVVKKEVACESEDVMSLKGPAIKIKTEREYFVKEEIDIPWDETNSAVDRDVDDVYSSKKHRSLFNAVVIVDKLPDSTVQKYLKSQAHSTQLHKEITESCDSDIALENRMKEKLDCRGPQNALNKLKCSKCGKEFKIFTYLLRHVQICTGTSCTPDSESLGRVKSEDFNDRIILFCEKCNKEINYNKSIERKKSIKSLKSRKMQCVYCKSMIIFKCAECKKQYLSRTAVICHMRIGHDAGQNYKCSECDYNSHVFDRLVQHYRQQHTPKIYDCSKCDMIFGSQQDFTKHSLQCGMQSYNCEYCSYKSYLKSCISKHIQCRHMADYRMTRIDCPTCKSTFKNKYCLSVHQTQCGKLHQFQCGECPFKTQYKQNLKLHVLRIHSIDGEVECPNCKKMQRSKQRLKDHLPVCKLKGHFKCNRCAFKTKYAANLREHTVRIHGINTGSGNSSKSDYQCDHCHSKFKTKADLYKHIVRCHLEEKNIVCSRCNKKFQNSVSLSKHLNYCGLKPYLQCTECPFKTYLKGQLTIHMDRKHRVFECPKCKVILSRKDYLKCHLERSCKKRFEIQ